MQCLLLNFRPHGIDYSQRVVDETSPDTEPEDSTSTESSTILMEDTTELQITEEEQFSNSTNSNT